MTMADEIAEFDDQLCNLITTMQNCLKDEVSRLTGAARLEKCDYLRNRHARAKQVLRSFQVELRELPAVYAGEYNEKYRKHDSELNQLQQDITWAIVAGESESGRRAVDSMGTKEIVNAAKAVQCASVASTARTKQVLSQTIQVGTNTAVQLRAQTEIIDRVNENMDELESNLKRADKQLRHLLRKMATDRIFILVTLLILGAVTASIVVVFVKPKWDGINAPLGKSPLPGINFTVPQMRS